RRHAKWRAVRNVGVLGGGHDDLLGVGAEVAIETGHQSGDTSADGDVATNASGNNRAGEVPTEARPGRLVDQAPRVEEPIDDAEVDRVDCRGGDADPDLAGR